MTTIKWRSRGKTSDGVLEREFTVVGARDTITGVMWAPAGGPPKRSPLVLIGHGGGGNKKAPTVVPTGRGFVKEHGITAVAIDAPGHGERGGVAGRSPEYYAMWADAETMTDHASADWALVLTALLDTGMFDPGRVGWSGMSMGSLIGVPYVAQEPRIKVAALGLCGTAGSTPSRGSIGGVLVNRAPLISCPVIFMLQWSDERFTRESSLALFELIGSRDKRMLTFLGAHGDMPEEGRRAARAFVAERLKG
jgi:dienelactone hydrolase